MNPNMLMYWEAMRAACENGAREFDFGRSHRGSGTYDFKKQWGAEEAGLNYFTYRDAALAQAAATDFYRSDAASRLSSVWRKLPAAVQRRLGPAVRRWVP
jgi:CelD/BcsL family acetyltransferase involved in cellulose biosynthesis